MNLVYDISKAIVDKWNTMSGYSGKISFEQADSSKTSNYGVYKLTDRQVSNHNNSYTVFTLQFNLYTRDIDSASGVIDFANTVKDKFYKATMSGSGSGYAWQTGHIQQSSPFVYMRGDRNYWQAAQFYEFFVNI